jgi:NAD(P)-dependent dehydrogenase (short-subunit alcohol dehydrogenase family)
MLIATSSSTLGSIGMASTYSLFPVPAYKVSKAALNMLTVQYAQSFADQGFSIFTLSPGVCILPHANSNLTNQTYSGCRPIWAVLRPI